ncbi:MAG: hypothetical protein M3124_08845 [Actinomycetota bacterium]|nr:hypothetical protein [Actinomycetota bacterium]
MVRLRARYRRTLIPFVVAFMSSAVIVAASAAPVKLFTATVGPEADVVAGETGVPMTATFTNVTSGSLDAVDLTVPATFSITGAESPSPKGTAAIVGDTLRLRELGLSAGQSATVEFRATVACKRGDFTWTVRASQSSSFSPPNKNYMLDTAASNLTTTVSGDCKAAFIEPGPQDAERSETGNIVLIRTEDHDPLADPVEGEILDGSGNRLDASHPLSNVSMSVQIANNPSGGSLVGTATVMSEESVATFQDGFGINESGMNYVLRLVPGNSNILPGGEANPSGLSDPFTIWDRSNKCASAGNCSSGSATSRGGKLQGELTLPNAAAGDTIFEGWNLESLNSCGSYQFVSDDQLTFGSTGNSFRIIEILIPKAARQLFAENGKPQMQVCFSSHTLQFTTRNGTLAGLDGDGFYTGLLPDSGQFPTLGGCSEAPQVLARKIARADAIITYCAPAGSSKGHS